MTRTQRMIAESGSLVVILTQFQRGHSMTVQNQLTPVGIDIGAYKHQVCIGEKGRSFSIDNNATGWRKLITKLKCLPEVRVTMEATGAYYLDLAIALSTAGLAVQVINPKAAHHFAKALSQRSKTDALDAGVLAAYSARMRFCPWQLPQPNCFALRALSRQILALTTERAANKNRLHALSAQGLAPKVLVQDLKRGIAQLDRRIAKLSEAALELIHGDPELSAQHTALVSATGVGDASALAVLGELVLLPRRMSARQCASHAGLDVRLHESGTSVAKPARLSKHGNRHLRSALYMPALVATQHDPVARAFYQRLISRGKTKLQALCAVMRKYLTAFWALIKNPQPFDTCKLFDVRQLEIA